MTTSRLCDILVALLMAAAFLVVTHAWRDADWPRVFAQALRLTR